MNIYIFQSLFLILLDLTCFIKNSYYYYLINISIFKIDKYLENRISKNLIFSQNVIEFFSFEFCSFK